MWFTSYLSFIVGLNYLEFIENGETQKIQTEITANCLPTFAPSTTRLQLIDFS